MRVDQLGYVAARVDEERRHRAEPVHQRLTPTHVARQETQIRQPRPVDQIGVAAYGNVVAEPPRILVRVGVAPDPHDQGRVVGGIPLLPAEPKSIGQSGRNQRGPQHVFGRLAQAEIDRDGQRRQQLRTGRHIGLRRTRTCWPGRPRGHGLIVHWSPDRDSAVDRIMTSRVERFEVP